MSKLKLIHFSAHVERCFKKHVKFNHFRFMHQDKVSVCLSNSRTVLPIYSKFPQITEGHPKKVITLQVLEGQNVALYIIVTLP